MNVFKCDRCQEYFSKQVTMSAMSVRCTYSNMYIGHGSYCARMLLDLCPSCKKSFENWFCSAGLDKKEGEGNGI